MGVTAIRIYSTERNGDKRVSLFANENQWTTNLRVDVGTEIATIYEDNFPKAYIHGWNHVEYLKDWEPPQPEVAITPVEIPPPADVGF